MAAGDQVPFSEVVSLLKGVTELEELGVYLGLSRTTIMEIRSIRGELGEKRLVLISKWLQSDPDASWAKLAKALFKLNYRVLASRIHQQYCPDAEGFEAQAEGGLEEAAGAGGSEKCMAMTRFNENKINGFFSSLLISLRKSLVLHEIDAEDVRQFLVTFFKSDDCIPESNNIVKIFNAVTTNGLWSPQHYGPVETLIQHLLPSDMEVKQLLKDYKSQLNGFHLSCKLVTYIRDNTSLPTNDSGDDPNLPAKFTLTHYKKLMVDKEPDRNVSELSLSYVQELWESIAEEFKIPSLTAILLQISAGSLQITWLVPPHWAELIKPNSKFCRKKLITVIAIDDHVVYHERQMMDYEKKFLQLCKKGSADISTFVELLKLGVDPDIHDQRGGHPLWHASYGGRRDLVEVFIDHGATVDLQTCNEFGETGLHAASGRGHVEVIIVLLQRGADVHILNKDGRTALGYASKNGHVAAVHVLLDSGALVNEGKRPSLWCASYGGKLEVAEVLLDQGAEVNQITDDEFGQTALHAASMNGHVKVISVLVAKGAIIDFQSKDGETALGYASANGHVAAVHVLLDNGALVNEGKRPSLWCASYGGKLEVAEVLLDQGAEVNQPTDNEFNETPLLTACGHDCVDVAGVLISRGASVNFQSKTGWTPLLWACDEGFSDIVKLLIQHNVQLEVQNHEGRTALLVASWRGYCHIVLQLLQATARLNSQDKEGLTALILAAQQGHWEILTALLEAKADPNVTEKTSGWTALFFAAKQGDMKSVQQLISKGASVDLKDKNGVTAYDVAKLSGHQAVCEELQRHSIHVIKTDITKEQTEQVKTSTKQFRHIFDFLEKTLLRGRVEKRRMLKFQQSSTEGTSSNILESRQSRNILLTEGFERQSFK